MSKIKTFFILFLIFINFVLSDICFGVPVDTGTSFEEQLIENKEKIKSNLRENKELYFESMKSYIFHGNLNKAGKLAERLILIFPEEDDVKSIYAMYLISQNKIYQAIKYLDLVKNDKNKYFLYAKAMLLRKKRKYDEGINLCSKAILIDKNNPYPFNILGRLYFDKKEYNQAIKNFKKAIALYDKFYPALINLGYTYYVLKNYNLSEFYFKKALKLSQSSFEVNWGLAQLYIVKNNIAYAYYYLKKCLKTRPNNQKVLLDIGIIQLKLRKYKEAEETGKKLLDIFDENGYYILADSLLHQNKFEEAKKILNNVKKDNLNIDLLKGELFLIQNKMNLALDHMKIACKKYYPFMDFCIYNLIIKLYLDKDINFNEIDRLLLVKEPKFLNFNEKTLYFLKGSIFAKKSNWEKAYFYFKKGNGVINGFIIDGVNSKELEAGTNKDELRHLNLAIIFLLRDYINNAKTELAKALIKNKYSIFSNYFMAQVYQINKERKKALEFYALSLKKAPHFFPSLYGMAETYIILGDLEKAYKYYKKALKTKKDSGILLKLGMLCEKIKEYGEAEKYYRELIKQEPNLFVGYNQLAWLLVQTNKNLDEALKMALKANELLPNNSSILDTLGWIYFNQKKYKKALKYLKKSVETNSNNPYSLYHLGITYMVLGNKNLAKKYLKKTLQISKNFEESSKIKRVLQEKK